MKTTALDAISRDVRRRTRDGTSAEQFRKTEERYKRLQKEALAAGKKGLAAEYKSNADYAAQRAELAERQEREK